MSLAASLAVGLRQLYILVCPCLTQPLNLLLSVLQLHSMPLHGPILLLQHLDGLLGFLGLPLLLCQLCLDLRSILFFFVAGLAILFFFAAGLAILFFFAAGLAMFWFDILGRPPFAVLFAFAR